MHRSRIPFLVGLAIGIGVLAGLIGLFGAARIWGFWQVPAGRVPFLDAEVIAAGAASHAEGFDPLRLNPHDVGQRPMNYPRIWQGLFAWGVGPRDAMRLGFVFAGLFVAGLALALPPLRVRDAGVMLLAVFSPAVLLGIERGNTDLVVFFVVSAVWATPKTSWRVLGVAVAMVLKLYPLLGAALWVGRERREAVRAWGLLAVLAVAYGAATFEDLRQISQATPRDTWWSFGAWVAPMRLVPDSATARWGALGIAMAWMTVCLIRRRRGGLGGLALEEVRLGDGFRLGAACYLGTFLLGNNFIYRLIFLLPALPQLLAWSRAESPRRSVAVVALAAALMSLWCLPVEVWLARATDVPTAGFVVVQAANWMLFGALTWLFCATLPDWLGGPRPPGVESGAGG